MIVHSLTCHIAHVIYQSIFNSEKLETTKLGHLSPGLALLGMVPRAGLLRCLGVIIQQFVSTCFLYGTGQNPSKQTWEKVKTQYLTWDTYHINW